VAAQCPLAAGLPTGGARVQVPATRGPAAALILPQMPGREKAHCLGRQAVGRACYIGI